MRGRCARGSVSGLFERPDLVQQHVGTIAIQGRAHSRGKTAVAPDAISRFIRARELGGTNGVAIGTGFNTGFNGGFNNDNWLENYGPLATDVRHLLNVSGLAELPGQFQVAVSVSAYQPAALLSLRQRRGFQRRRNEERSAARHDGESVRSRAGQG